MVILRLYTYKPNGTEQISMWSFQPLRDKDGWDYDREDDDGTNGTPRRRPFFRREVRELTIGAGLLKFERHRKSFLTLLDAHKIEWKREVGGVEKWIPYVLDIGNEVRFERIEDIDPLRQIEIKLTQEEAIPFTRFNDPDYQFTDNL